MSNPSDFEGFVSKKKQAQAYFTNLLNQWKDKLVETITGGSVFPAEITLKDVVSYALDRQNAFPEIVSTRIAFFEQTKGERVFVQTMLNEKGESVFADAEKQNFVGRIFPKTTAVSQEIKNLLADNVDCIIQLPETEITFKDVLLWGQNAKKENPAVSAVRFSRLVRSSSDKPSFVITALDAFGKEIFTTPEKKQILGKYYPCNAKIDERLKELLEDDVTCVIPLE